MAQTSASTQITGHFHKALIAAFRFKTFTGKASPLMLYEVVQARDLPVAGVKRWRVAA